MTGENRPEPSAGGPPAGWMPAAASGADAAGELSVSADFPHPDV